MMICALFNTGVITKIEVSQDARTIVFGTAHRTIEIWTIESGSG